MALALLGLSANGTWSNPLFCGDEGLDAMSGLTGCSVASNGFGRLSGENKEWGGGGLQPSKRSQADIQSGPPPHTSVLRINPKVYESSDPDPEPVSTANTRSAGASSPDPDVSNVISNAFSSDGDALYLNLDKDGTYIFLGEPEREDGVPEDYSLEDPTDVPNQIGFGKKWRF